MSIRIYNSLVKEKQELIPVNGKAIKMYSCGVTVYDRCHIGHARSLYIFDVIKRYLEYKGYNVRFVRNITDIDDKIINKAKDLNKAFEDVVRENIEFYKEDLKSLGVRFADEEPKATENIPEMVRHIEKLIEKGFAYEVDGDVYYNVRRFKDYGKLSGQGIEKMQEAVRIEQDSKKKDPLDFALWKKSKEGEPSWQSPWGEGRPGWHIECSVMSLKYLECETLDIHAGGRDLIFPHHENEIAQSEALTGKPFAKYWIHHGLLTINGQKMAKSLGNFITIQDAVKKYEANDLKMFFLLSHYASPVDFTEEKIVAAHKALQRFRELINRDITVKIGVENFSGKPVEFIERHKKRFGEAMDDDFNTPQALGCLFDLVTDTNKFMAGSKNEDYVDVIWQAKDTVDKLLEDIFGINLGMEYVLSMEEEDLLKQREDARDKKDFKRSDELRDLLKEKRIIVEDTKDGQKWRK